MYGTESDSRINDALYLDDSATTKPTKLALEAFNDVCKNHWLNPSSTLYSVDAKNLLDTARDIISNWICCSPEQIFFTSGATEAANWVIQTLAQDGARFYRSTVEHPCVYNTLNYMRARGCTVKDLDVDGWGCVNKSGLYPYLDECHGIGKTLVCVMDSNNELGTIQPTHQIANICHQYGASLLTDMTQSFAHSKDIDVTYLGMDYAFGSAHKFGALRGAGFLYARDPEKLKPFMYGGGQEDGLRSGTENLAAIWAMAVRFEEVASMRMVNAKKIGELKDYLLNSLSDDNCQPNLPYETLALPNVVSIQTAVDANKLIAALANLSRPIYLSAGSACSTGENKPSRILKACGFSDEHAQRTVRISLNGELTKEDIDYFVEKFKGCIRLLGGD